VKIVEVLQKRGSLKKMKRKSRKASLYLVRYYELNHVGQLCRFVEFFFNKRRAIGFQKSSGGILTRWEYREEVLK